MDHRFLPVFFSLFFSFVNAQVLDWDWARTCTGTQDESGMHLAQDPSGNLIVCGFYSSATASIGGITLSNSGSANSKDLIIAKYNGAGALQWLRTAQGPGDEVPTAVTCDASGNIYVTGNYDSPALVIGTSTLNNSSAYGDIFLLKYDPSGALLWSRTYGGNLLDEVNSLKCDNGGDCYVAGSFRSLSVNFGNYGVVNSGNSDAFLVKINSAGTPQWAKQIGGAQNDFGMAVCHDGSGNVFVMGNFDSSTLSSYTLTNVGGSDIFIARYDASNGSLLNTRSIGGTQNENAWCLAADASGVYVSASFQSSSLNLGIVTLNNGSTRDMLLMKLNSTLSTLWAQRNNGNLNSNATDLFIENSGNILMSGSFDFSSLTLGGSTLTNPSGLSDGFIVRYDASGVVQMARNTNGAGSEFINGVTSDNNGSIFVAGVFSPSLAIGATTFSGSGGQELLIAKLCLLPAPPQLVSSVSVCPKQYAVITASVSAGTIVNWYSAQSGGNLLLSGNNTFTTFNPGTYYAGTTNTANACNSVSRTAVTLSVQAGPSVTVNGTVLTASQGNTFKWLECKKDSLVPGATSNTYTLTATGFYAAIVTNNSCTDTSACVFYSVNATTGTVTVPGDTLKLGIVKTLEGNAVFEVYPNPSQGSFTIKADKNFKLYLSDLMGREIIQVELNAANSFYKNIEGLPQGLYILSDDQHRNGKLIVVSN